MEEYMVTFSNKEFGKRYCKFIEYIISYLKLRYPVEFRMAKLNDEWLADYDDYTGYVAKRHIITIYGYLPAKDMRLTIAHELRHAFQLENLGYYWDVERMRYRWKHKLTNYGIRTNMSSKYLPWERDARTFELKV